MSNGSASIQPSSPKVLSDCSGRERERLVTFADLVAQYVCTVGVLRKDFSPKNLLICLIARDAVEAGLRRNGEEDVSAVNELLGADRELRVLEGQSLKLENLLAEWRASLRPPSEWWWWYPDLPGWVQRKERFVLLLSMLLFPVSLGVSIDLARRYSGENGSGFGVIIPILAATCGSLSVGGAFSSSFRDRLTGVIKAMGLNPYFRPVVFLFILACLGATVCAGALYPAISRFYNDRGLDGLDGRLGRNVQLSAAKQELERSLRFDPSNAVAHYNLGRIYEHLLDEDRAETEYLIAVAADLDLAYNNIGYLFLQQGRYDDAAFVLKRGLSGTRAGGAEVGLDVRYSLLKNFGWARFGQNRYGDARAHLEDAVLLAPDRPEAHCLLAKALLALGDEDAHEEARMCLGFAWEVLDDPALDLWLGEARESLSRRNQ